MEFRTTCTTFRTNIDCCQKFMSALSQTCFDGTGTTIVAPNVGDSVIVHRTPNKIVTLEVCAREWDITSWRIQLHVELHLNHVWRTRGIEAFTKWVEDRA